MVGLHMADVEKLTRVLRRLVDGGRIVAEGTPEQVVASGSHTGVALAPVLARR